MFLFLFNLNRRFRDWKWWNGERNSDKKKHREEAEEKKKKEKNDGLEKQQRKAGGDEKKKKKKSVTISSVFGWFCVSHENQQFKWKQCITIQSRLSFKSKSKANSLGIHFSL